MTDREPEGQRFYRDFASWWRLISPVEDYEEEAGQAATLLRSASREVQSVLELGSGGGHNAFYLKQHFELTLVDLSEDMLVASRRLNPECRHLAGDMRTLRLGESFDAVFVHDAVDYMKTETELQEAIETAFAHVRPRGIAVFFPDHVTEAFEPSTEHGGNDDPDGRGVRYLEWSWDPDPDDGRILTEYSFLFREPDGRVTPAHETHETGLFERATWLRLLQAAGFEPLVVDEETAQERTPRSVFLGHRP